MLYSRIKQLMIRVRHRFNRSLDTAKRTNKLAFVCVPRSFRSYHYPHPPCTCNGPPDRLCKPLGNRGIRGIIRFPAKSERLDKH